MKFFLRDTFSFNASYCYYLRVVLSVNNDSYARLQPWSIYLRLNTDKKENQIFLICKEIQIWAVARSYTVWLTASSHLRKYLRISSYMTLQLLRSEFPYIWGKFDFLFYQWRKTVFKYLSRIFKHLRGPGIDSKELILPAYVALCPVRQPYLS